MEAPPQYYPFTRFAAISDVRFATTNDVNPVPSFEDGGVLLCELAPGEFGFIVADESRAAVAAMTITSSWVIVANTEYLEVRCFTGAPCARTDAFGRMWMHVRITDRLIYAEFNRILWDIYWQVQSKTCMLQERLHHIAFAQPSNLVDYCRQYLGNDFADNLEDVDLDETEGQEQAGDNVDNEETTGGEADGDEAGEGEDGSKGSSPDGVAWETAAEDLE
ncbi:hypothetical protein GSI_01692 [Ganoderma sinense ZZ0214-1]|uniref:Uncharacterized protein n=1 Tax=Ganoderma sinense ZZ0214-1 TaxID=1077348 RepID=A0A2G8SQK8_9APHY|nr:hypothetical protein GSI_01692 [Ganoderma sinense ZZ0214-1]